MSKILFYEDTYYLFSNFSAHAVEYKGKLYPTSEHAYHAAKFDSEEIKEKIKNAKSPLEAKDLANNVYKTVRKAAWDEIKAEVMYQILKEKLNQHKEVQEILLRTSQEEIIENSPVDYYWGCGQDGTGSNQLGKIWMRLRKEVIEKKLSLDQPR